jgi:hypothetical protein
MKTTTKTVRITTERTGTNFGWIGVLKLRNGRRVESTDVRPQQYQAFEAAASLAGRRGYKVSA